MENPGFTLRFPWQPLQYLKVLFQSIRRSISNLTLQVPFSQWRTKTKAP